MRMRVMVGVLFAAALILGFGCGKGEPEKSAPAKETSRVSTETAPPPEPAPETAPEAAAPAVPEPPAAPAHVSPEDFPVVVARVGDREISNIQLARHVNFRLTDEARRGRAPEATESNIRGWLGELIDEEVLSVLAAQANIPMDPAEVDKKMEEFKAQWPSNDEYEKALIATNTTADDIRQRLANKLLKEKYMEQITQDLAVTDDELGQRYESMKGLGQMERPVETLNLSHILVRASDAEPASWDAAKAKIDAARGRVVAGEDFLAVAKEISEDPVSASRGGTYREVRHGVMAPEFDSVLFATPLNEISEPFKTREGWHILKVLAQNKIGTMTLDEIGDDLRRFMREEKQKEVVLRKVQEARGTAVPVEVLYPAGAAPAESAPAEAAPAESAPAESAPEESAPAEAAPAEAAPAEAAPAEAAPAEAAPAEAAPAEAAPAESAPEEAAPAESAPAEAAPAESAPAESAPAESAPAEAAATPPAR